ncbi:MAG TPA: hypothetical protein VMN81_06620 [Vicinamibacterales bacterium]|nr:hypothetical protein [Vicinamibacterales bacterium]
MSPSPGSRLTRETRLLLIIITLSVVVLVVLSRFRFPDDEPASTTAGATPLPLERLAARATYDELATIISELGRRVTPSVSVLRIEAAGEQRFVPAIRVRPDLLLAHVAGSSRILAIVGQNIPVDIAAYDDRRELVLVRVPSDPSAVVTLETGAQSAARPRYVAAMEGTPGGPALRPLFLGRTDRVPDDRYGEGLLVLGGVLVASPGSLIFGLDGSFVGICVIEDGYAAGVTGPSLAAAVAGMAGPPSR